MSDRSIIFSAPMVQALLAGRKTQTRRVLKPQPRTFEVEPGVPCDVTLEPCDDEPWPRVATGRVITRQEVRYRPDMRLWVREAFYGGFHLDDHDMPVGDMVTWYRADGGPRWLDPDTDEWRDNPPWRSPIHMPRWASRLTLTVTNVRVQRLQDIIYDDILAEGAPLDPFHRDGTRDGSNPHMVSLGPGRAISPRGWYHRLWDELHGAGAWAKNPWIVALTFIVEQRNIDAVTAKAANP